MREGEESYDMLLCFCFRFLNLLLLLSEILLLLLLMSCRGIDGACDRACCCCNATVAVAVYLVRRYTSSIDELPKSLDDDGEIDELVY